MKALFVSIMALVFSLTAYSQTGNTQPKAAAPVDYSKPVVANRAPRTTATAAKATAVNSMAPEAAPNRPARKAQPRPATTTDVNTPQQPQKRQ